MDRRMTLSPIFSPLQLCLTKKCEFPFAGNGLMDISQKRTLVIKLFVLSIFCFATLGVFAQNRSIIAIAHRGEHLEHPENTLPAIQAAIDLGFDYAELD